MADKMHATPRATEKRSQWLIVFFMTIAVLLSALAFTPTMAFANPGGHHGGGYCQGQGQGLNVCGCRNGQNEGWCGYIDADNNGVCDRYEDSGPLQNGWCDGYVDVNDDGICDNCAHQSIGCQSYQKASAESIIDTYIAFMRNEIMNITSKLMVPNEIH